VGFITSQSIKSNEKVEFKVTVDYSEALQLMGRATNIHLFSEDVPQDRSNVLTRGKRGETKYLLIPRGLNKDLKSLSEVRCQRKDTDVHTVLFFVIKK